MTIERAKNVGPAKIDVAYERIGEGEPLVLVMGLGAQLIAWPDGFCEHLVARGYSVIRFDNRDAGESTHMTGTPDLAAALRGDFSTVTYTLSDMAADTVGLLDALGIERARFVGASLGGFVAQTIAIEYPERISALTSIMSSTGARDVGQPSAGTAAALFVGGSPRTREESIARAVDAARLIGSPAYPPDLEAVAARAGRSYDRGFDPPAFARQGAATLASGDRTAKLRQISLPTTVVHGAADRMVDPSGGRATAAAIPGAKLEIIDGMGHDLPRALWPRIVDLVA
ncbi:MAG TPA: alpha/beta hydrolase [Kofleriaceae bacterium]|jgi:pimeloyl-ACP methyl ester carboxylesterase